MIRFLIALWGSKLLTFIYKFKNNNQDNLPEVFVNKICNDFLKRIKKPETVICITGSTSKNTVSNLISEILIKNGQNIIHNNWDVNKRASVINCLLNGITIFNTRKRVDIAVLTIDELTSSDILPSINPNYLVVTNLMRDSMTKNAHPFFIFDKINNSLQEETTLILNSDDPISSRLGEDKNKCIFYSINKQDFEENINNNIINDFKICPNCNNLLEYDFIRYPNTGKVSCPKCEFKSKEAEYIGTKIDYNNYELEVKHDDNTTNYKLTSDNITSAYNTICAITILNQISIKEEKIKRYLETIKKVSSNYITNIYKGIEVKTLPAKSMNSVKTSQACNSIANLKGTIEIILVIDNTCDKQNGSEATCWIYDTDFEMLNKNNIKKIIIGGNRNKDYKLRLLLGGIKEENIICVPNEEETYKYLTIKDTDKIIIIHEENNTTEAKRLKENIKNMIMNEEVIK